MEPAQVLTLNNINFDYGRQPVLQQLSLQLQAGRVHGIVGDNGAGKTTLFNLLSGNLQPQSGNITYAHGAQQIAYLETDPYFYHYMTGAEYLHIICPAGKGAIEGWNAIFELPLDQYASQYSTGMKKKLALLGVLLLDKPVIILDEPFNGLDLKSCEIIHYIIGRLKQAGKTVLLSSHILETMLNNADEISFLEGGTILQTYQKDSFAELEKTVRSKFVHQVTTMIDGLL
jgi:ABC-2 type transport system ATP-binding protein